MNKPFIYFITGASGTGKTTLVNLLEEKYTNNNWAFLHFDSIGVPETEKMIEEYGSIEEWQKQTTFKWIERLLDEYKHFDKIIFEGQVNPEFIQEGFSKYNHKNYKIILLDCNEKVLEERLTDGRDQPELLTKEMRNWMRFLRDKTKELDIKMIDTSDLNKQQLCRLVEELIEK